MENGITTKKTENLCPKDISLQNSDKKKQETDKRRGSKSRLRMKSFVDFENAKRCDSGRDLLLLSTRSVDTERGGESRQESTNDEEGLGGAGGVLGKRETA